MSFPFDVDYSKVPVPRMADAVKRYVELGIQPGHFLTALFSNNLMEAIGRADDENAAKLREWCVFVKWELPVGCHGSPAKVSDWMKYTYKLSAVAE
jgi:hypothetical protein